MTIAVVNEGVLTAGSVSEGTATFSVTITGGDILIIAVPIVVPTGGNPYTADASATYNGGGMTVEGIYRVIPSTNRPVQHLYAYKVSPATGTYNIVVNTNTGWGQAANQKLYFWTLTGVDTADPFGGNNATNGTPGTRSVSLSPTADDSWIVAIVTAGDSASTSDATIAFTSPTVEDYDTNGVVYYKVGGGHRVCTTAGTYVIEATVANSSDMALSAIVINAAAGGASEDVSMSVGRSLGALAGGGAVAGAGMTLGVAAAVASGKSAEASTAVTAALAQMLAQSGTVAAEAAAVAGRAVDVGSERIVEATAAVDLARLTGIAADGVAAWLANVVVDRLDATALAADATAGATVTVDGVADAGVVGGATALAAVSVDGVADAGLTADALADGVVALLASRQVLAAAVATSEGGIEIVAVRVAGVAGDATAWATATVAVLQALVAVGAIAGAAQTVDADLAVGITVASAAAGTAVAVGLAALLRRMGFAAVAVADGAAPVAVQFAAGAGAEASATLAGTITLAPGLGVATAAGQQVAAVLSVDVRRGDVLAAQGEVDEALGLWQATAMALAGRAVALGVATLAVEWQVAAYGATALFTVGDGRLFLVPAHRRQWAVAEQDRIFVVA